MAAAQARKARLDGLKVTIPVNAGAEGKLFGSVGNREIAEALEAAGVEVDKNEVRLLDGHLRACGEYEIGIHLHSEVDALVTVDIVPE